MTLVEFYEALARVAEEASLPVGPGVVEVVCFFFCVCVFIYFFFFLYVGRI